MSQSVDIPVEHVSDTAFLVAWCRALESEAPDARFTDPFARRLAEPKVQALSARIPFLEHGRWLMTVRTCLLDEHILRLVAEGVDTVVNLATGLDTRPYRLALPKNLLWIEADLPGVIDYKAECLKSAQPHCRIERIALDLSQDVARHQLISYVGRISKKALVITEGLLMYLPQSAVSALASDLQDETKISAWLMDYYTTDFFQWMNQQMNTEVKPGEPKVQLSFLNERGLPFFAEYGWKPGAFTSFLEGGERLNRLPPAGPELADAKVKAALEQSGIAFLSRG